MATTRARYYDIAMINCKANNVSTEHGMAMDVPERIEYRPTSFVWRRNAM